jgi:hypothetical protein
MSTLLAATPNYFDAYVVVFGDQHAIGSVIRCVYPPETGINPRSWRVLDFDVVLEMYGHGANRGMARVFHKTAERALDTEEIAYFGGLMASWVPPVYEPIEPHYVAVIGSRQFPYPDAVASYIATLPSNTVIVSGGANGVDSWAEQAARNRRLFVKVFPADWNTYGKSAGFRRNADIVNACDELTAFWDGVSRGTAHSVELARKAGKPVTVITPDMCKEVEAA